MDEQLYEIQDGVRRAKAAWLCGYETIPAQIGDDPQVFEMGCKNSNLFLPERTFAYLEQTNLYAPR